MALDKASAGTIEHRKAFLMIRQGLDPNSRYADACLHGNGMTALQWRDGKGEISGIVGGVVARVLKGVLTRCETVVEIICQFVMGAGTAILPYNLFVEKCG
jgi:hypothetical protein